MKLGPYDLNSIVTGDARELSKAIPDESVDLCLEDPPYGINYVSSRTTRNNGQPRKTDTSFGKDVFNPDFLPELFRILKIDGALYLFTRWDVIHLWRAELKACGFNVVQRIIWNKCHWKMGDLRYYGNQIEDILFCRKGPHSLNWPKREGNLWSSSSGYLPESQWDHPTQKPEAIIKKIISYSSNEGDVVLDTHCGSGTTLACAKQLSRRFLGFDIQEKYTAMTRQRVLMTQPPLPMPEPVQSEMSIA